MAREEESHKQTSKTHKPSFVVVLNTTLCLLDVDIKVVHNANEPSPVMIRAFG